MKKIALISLAGPLLVIVFRVVTIIKQVRILGLDGSYQCAISVFRSCSFFEYVFKGDEAFIMYVMIISSFVVVFLVIFYISWLLRLYKKNNYKLFYILVGITISLVVVSPFIISYLQFIL